MSIDCALVNEGKGVIGCKKENIFRVFRMFLALP